MKEDEPMGEYLTTVTWHGTNRSKERCGFKNRKTISKNVELAFQSGKRAEYFASWERRYLINEVYDNCYAVAYNGFCYIFNQEDCCVTMYELPTWFGKKKCFRGKERIRNCKKFSNHYLDDTIVLQ